MRPHTRVSPDRRVSPSRSRTGSKPSPGRELHPHHHLQQQHQHHVDEGPTPICRCRVLYLGSSVPHVTKDGLQGIQEPLRELYPDDGALGAKGIDSWLSVWSNGFLLENVDENRKKVSRFFPIDSLHYCAAVRYVQVPGTSGESVPRFLPLDSPFARNPNINHPPLFAAILRRTTGIKVLECHVFICKRETAANALVRCSFHAYADSTYAKHLENGASLYGTVAGGGGGGPTTPLPPMMMVGGNTFLQNGSGDAGGGREFQQSVMEMSDDSLTSVDRLDDWRQLNGGGGSGDSPPQSVPNRQQQQSNGNSSPNENGNNIGADEISVFNGDDNHKVWAGKEPPGVDIADGLYGDYGSTMRSFRSSASGLSTRHRPRQMMMQSPPPPPIPEELVKGDPNSGSERKAEKKAAKKKKSVPNKSPRGGSGDLTDGPDGDLMMMMRMNGGAGPSNGSIVNGGRSGSVFGGRKMSAGSFMGIAPPQTANGRPPPGMMMNGGGPPRGLPPPHPMMMGHMPPPHRGGKKSGTFSARQKGGPPRPIPPYMMYGGNGGPPPPPHPHLMHPHHMMLPPPQLIAPPGYPMYGPGGQMMFPPHPMMGGGSVGGGGPPHEEPNYMPHSVRPLSPIASYQPGHFPHEAYYNQQQYATIDKAGKYRKHHPHHNNNNKSNSKQSKQQQQRHPSSESNADDSEYGGGGGGGGDSMGIIYKRGHMNERAFAASMRNEHRSRSHGSLANLPFDALPPTAGGAAAGGGDSSDQADGDPAASERRKAEMMQQMMAEMDLEEERIVRSEVPANFYPPRMMYRGGSVDPMIAAGLYPGVHMNGGVGHHPTAAVPVPVNGHGRRRR